MISFGALDGDVNADLPHDLRDAGIDHRGESSGAVSLYLSPC